MSDESRRQLILNLWPDKVLYGGLLLLVAGLGGMLWVMLVPVAGIAYGEALPSAIADHSPAVSLVASGAAAALGLVAIASRSPALGLAGSAAGVAALGLAGVGPAMAVLAGAFFVQGWREGEGRSAATLRLQAREWPDKTLAAGMLGLVNGVLTAGWGIALFRGLVEMQRLGAWQEAFGLAALGLGAFSVLSALLLLFQRGPVLGLAAASGCFAAFGFLVAGPLLALATMALVLLGVREREFAGAPAAAPGRAAR